MPPFKFRLQQVLEFRSQLEDQAKMAFAAAKDAHERQVKEIERLAAALEEARSKRHTAIQTSLDEVWLLENYCKGLAEDLKTARIRLNHLAILLEEARQKLVQAMQDRKLLDKLKERQQERHVKEEKLSEQRFNDEISTLRPRAASF